MASQIARFAVKSAREVIPKQGLGVQQARWMSESGSNPTIVKKQELFQKDANTPVYLKGGVLDQVLYRTTMGCCVLAIGLFVWNVSGMAVKK